MTHGEIVDIAAKWLKNHKENNIGIHNCPLVLKEFVALTAYGETPDVIGWSYCCSVLIEVKASREDFLRDKKKRHKKFSNGMGEKKFYCCPANLIKPEELPEGWGLLYVNEKKKIEIVKIVNVDKEADLHSERTMLLSVIRRMKKEPAVNEPEKPTENCPACYGAGVEAGEIIGCYQCRGMGKVAVKEKKPTDEEIEKWVDERINKVYIGYVGRGLRDSMIDAAKWMRNKLTDKERR